jgi:hypothetical protein
MLRNSHLQNRIFLLFLFQYQAHAGAPKIKMKTEEIWQEGSRVVVDYYNHRITVTSIGDFDKARALRCQQFIFRIFDESASKFDLLIDLTHEGKQGPGVRKIWKQINNHPKVRFVALCGIHSISKVVHTFIIGFKKHPRMRFFTEMDSALAWLGQLIIEIQHWFDTSKQELPPDHQEVLIMVDGENYISRYEAAKRMFRVDDELRETAFSVDKYRIFWTPQQNIKFKKTEYFNL